MYDRLCHLNVVHYNLDTLRCMEQHRMVLTTVEHRSVCMHFQVFAKSLSGIQEFHFNNVSLYYMLQSGQRVYYLDS